MKLWSAAKTETIPDVPMSVQIQVKGPDSFSRSVYKENEFTERRTGNRRVKPAGFHFEKKTKDPVVINLKMASFDQLCCLS